MLQYGTRGTSGSGPAYHCVSIPQLSPIHASLGVTAAWPLCTHLSATKETHLDLFTSRTVFSLLGTPFPHSLQGLSSPFYPSILLVSTQPNKQMMDRGRKERNEQFHRINFLNLKLSLNSTITKLFPSYKGLGRKPDLCRLSCRVCVYPNASA